LASGAGVFSRRLATALPTQLMERPWMLASRTSGRGSLVTWERDLLQIVCLAIEEARRLEYMFTTTVIKL
jgi:hypothetical protein